MLETAAFFCFYYIADHRDLG